MDIIISVLIGYAISIVILLLMKGKTKWEQRLYAIFERKSKFLRNTIIIIGNAAFYLFVFLAYWFRDIDLNLLLNIIIIAIIVLIWVFISILTDINKNSK